MKRMILAIAMSACISMASAQGNREGGKQKKFDRTEQMVKDYGLDSKQAEKLKVLNEKYADVFRHGRPGRGIRPDGQRPPRAMKQGQQPDGVSGATTPQNRQRPQREDMEKRMKAHKEKMEAYDAELKKIMTESQYKAYTKKREEMRKNPPQRPRMQRVK